MLNSQAIALHEKSGLKFKCSHLSQLWYTLSVPVWNLTGVFQTPHNQKKFWVNIWVEIISLGNIHKLCHFFSVFVVSCHKYGPFKSPGKNTRLVIGPMRVTALLWSMTSVVKVLQTRQQNCLTPIPFNHWYTCLYMSVRVKNIHKK